MANANVLELMAQYDFKSPINITLLFEDSDDDLELLEENEQKEYSDTDTNVQDNSALKKKGDTERCDTNTQNKTKDVNESLLVNVTVTDLQNDQASFEMDNQSKKNELEKNPPNGEAGKTINIFNESGHQHEISPDPHEHVTSEVLSAIRQLEEHVPIHNYTREPASLLDNLLNTLSEHLILVMHAFYRYGINRKASDTLTPDYQKREKLYTLIKHHFFELSYHTMISLIVPQEQNPSFINIFLENTVSIANSKSKNWKCHRGHLEPFFNEIVTWTKNKRCIIKRVSSELSRDKNYHLKQRLNKPLQPMNQNFLEKPTSQRQYVSNNVCIFSSGSLGVEINVNPDTLINCNRTQYSHAMEWSRVQNNNPISKSYQTGSESRNVLQACENQTNNYANTYNSKHHRRLTPYNVVQNSISNQNIHHQLHESHARRHHKNTEKRKPTQLQTNNETHITSPSNFGVKNAVNYNNDQMLRLQSQTTNGVSAVQEPVISNIISLNPIAHSNIDGRCCVCDKTTYTTCSKCNKPYCSFLCQELHKQYNKTCTS